MKSSDIMDRMSFVIFGEDTWRATYRQDGDSIHMYYDTHGMNVNRAKRTLKNIIALAPCEMDLSVIHGYRGGTAIKDMIWDSRCNLGGRLDREHMTVPAHNPGITNAHIKRAVWNA